MRSWRPRLSIPGGFSARRDPVGGGGLAPLTRDALAPLLGGRAHPADIAWSQCLDELVGSPGRVLDRPLRRDDFDILAIEGQHVVVQLAPRPWAVRPLGFGEYVVAGHPDGPVAIAAGPDSPLVAFERAATRHVGEAEEARARWVVIGRLLGGIVPVEPGVGWFQIGPLVAWVPGRVLLTLDGGEVRAFGQASVAPDRDLWGPAPAEWPRHLALESSVRADRSMLSVYADWLLENGDSRGMALSRALVDADDPRVRVWQAENPVPGSLVAPGEAAARWGPLVSSLTPRVDGDALTAWLDHPVAMIAERASLLPTQDAVAGFVARATPSPLRVVRFEPYAAPDQPAEPLDLTALWPALGGVAGLVIHAPVRAWGRVAAPSLVDLTLRLPDDEPGHGLVGADLPALAWLWLEARGVSADALVSFVSGLPSARDLALDVSAIPSAVIRALSGRAGLRRLALGGQLAPDAVGALIALAELTPLAELWLSGLHPSDPAFERIAAAWGPRFPQRFDGAV